MATPLVLVSKLFSGGLKGGHLKGGHLKIGFRTEIRTQHFALKFALGFVNSHWFF